MKINKCLDCNKEIHRRSIRCIVCKGIQHGKEMSGKNHPSYEDGKTLRKLFCIDCNRELSRMSCYRDVKRCNSCTRKEKLRLDPTSSPNYKDGKSKIESFCKCGKKLSSRAFQKGITKCRSCSAKEYSKNYSYIGQKGSDNLNWKGGISTLTNLIRNCPKYNEWRKSCFNRDHYTCQSCNQVSGKLEVDHIKKFSIIMEEFLNEYSQFSPIEDKETLVRLSENHIDFWNISNGRTLCKQCHKQTATYGNKKGN